MNEPLLPHTPPLLDTASPSPKCAICLGVCSNKCYSDSCMHEFCFSCLMKWSKIKAECPLCKKQFKSILYNIKSNDEYEEYVVTDPVAAPASFLDLEVGEYLYLPPVPSRHFQFRTTFTVDPDGELAIQQMLLSHPLTSTTNFPLVPRYRSRHGNSRSRGVSSATSFRRSIYASNLWVGATSDFTGRFREDTPQFYRENPSARNRLVPWLNRELNALLRENTQQVMNLVDIIMEHLPRWHIRSRSFRNLLLVYMNEKTDHFVHEFYHFMRSPFDMIGYDRHITYSEQPTTYTFTISDYEDEYDSDVTIVNVSAPITINNNPFRQPTIEVIEINSSDSSHESDVIIRDAPVEVVDLLHSDSETNLDDVGRGQTPPSIPYGRDQSLSTEHTKTLLPLKIRLKNKHPSRETKSRKKKKSLKRYPSCSTCTSSSSSKSSDSSSSSSSESSHRRSKKWRKYKKSKSRSYKEYKKLSKEKSRLQKYKKLELTSSSSTTITSSSSSSVTSVSATNSILPKKRKNTNFDSDDNIPLSKIRNKEIQNRSISHTVTSSVVKNSWHNSSTSNDPSQPSCSLWQTNVRTTSPLLDDYVYNFPSNSMYNYQYPSLQNFPVDNRSSYHTYHPQNASHYTSSGMLAYQHPHLSYTPPVDTNVPYYKNEYRFESVYNNQENNHTPICVNIGVGTSPIKTTVTEEYTRVKPCSSGSSGRMQSVIVKKEQSLIPPSSCFLYQNDSSDSNN